MSPTDAYNKPLTNSISNQGRHVTPSFTQTGVPDKNVAGGGPMTFEPGSIS